MTLDGWDMPRHSATRGPTFGGAHLFGKPPGWWEYAACADEDSDRFFEEKWYAVVKRICQTCPVLVQCRRATDEAEQTVRGTSAVDSRYLHGVFAGETPRERARRRMRERDQGAA